MVVVVVVVVWVWVCVCAHLWQCIRVCITCTRAFGALDTQKGNGSACGGLLICGHAVLRVCVGVGVYERERERESERETCLGKNVMICGHAVLIRVRGAGAQVQTRSETLCLHTRGSMPMMRVRFSRTNLLLAAGAHNPAPKE